MLIDLPDATNFRPGAVRTTEGFTVAARWLLEFQFGVLRLLPFSVSCPLALGFVEGLGFRGLGFSGPGAHCWISGLALALVGIGRLGLKLKGFMASGRLLGAVKNL